MEQSVNGNNNSIQGDTNVLPETEIFTINYVKSSIFNAKRVIEKFLIAESVKNVDVKKAEKVHKTIVKLCDEIGGSVPAETAKFLADVKSLSDNAEIVKALKKVVTAIEMVELLGVGINDNSNTTKDNK